MSENDRKNPPIQVCTIRILFPVNSDDDAIAYKKKIGNVLSDIPKARIEFSLMSRPPLAPDES